MSRELSERECQVMQLLSQDGLSNKEIARHLGISDATVKIYMRYIFQKLGVHKRSAAAILFRQSDWMKREAARRKGV